MFIIDDNLDFQKHAKYLILSRNRYLQYIKPIKSTVQGHVDSLNTMKRQQKLELTDSFIGIKAFSASLTSSKLLFVSKVFSYSEVMKREKLVQ